MQLYLRFTITWKTAWPFGSLLLSWHSPHMSKSLHSRHLICSSKMSLLQLAHLFCKLSCLEYLERHKSASLSVSKSLTVVLLSHLLKETFSISSMELFCLLKNSSSALSSSKYPGFAEHPTKKNLEALFKRFHLDMVDYLKIFPCKTSNFQVLSKKVKLKPQFISWAHSKIKEYRSSWMVEIFEYFYLTTLKSS